MCRASMICHCEICGNAYELGPDQAEVAIVSRMEDGSEHEYKVCDECFGLFVEPLIGCKPREANHDWVAVKEVLGREGDA